MFNQSSKKSYAKYGKYTDLQTHFSEKNIWHSSQVFQGIAVPKFQGNKSFLSNVLECGCDGNLLSEQFQPFINNKKIRFSGKKLKKDQ